MKPYKDKIDKIDKEVMVEGINTGMESIQADQTVQLRDNVPRITVCL